MRVSIGQPGVFLPPGHVFKGSLTGVSSEFSSRPENCKCKNCTYVKCKNCTLRKTCTLRTRPVQTASTAFPPESKTDNYSLKTGNYWHVRKMFSTIFQCGTFNAFVLIRRDLQNHCRERIRKAYDKRDSYCTESSVDSARPG